MSGLETSVRTNAEAMPVRGGRQVNHRQTNFNLIRVAHFCWSQQSIDQEDCFFRGEFHITGICKLS
jgi:hypothetical protein